MVELEAIVVDQLQAFSYIDQSYASGLIAVCSATNAILDFDV